MKAWYCIRHLNPVRFILSKFQLCISDTKAFHKCSNKLYFLKYNSNHLCSMNQSDVASPVLPKAQLCPSLAVAAYVGFGSLQGLERRVYIPRLLWVFYCILTIKTPLKQGSRGTRVWLF